MIFELQSNPSNRQTKWREKQQNLPRSSTSAVYASERSFGGAGVAKGLESPSVIPIVSDVPRAPKLCDDAIAVLHI